MQSVNLKLKGMRKEQDFVIYPFKEGDTHFKIQSGTRIGRFDAKTGIGMLSKAKSSGAYFMHLMPAMGAKPYTLSPVDLSAIRMMIFAEGTEGNINNVLFFDNSGAKSILDL